MPHSCWSHAYVRVRRQRSLAQRILEIRAHLAKEWMEDLVHVKAENADLLRESLMSFSTTSDELDDDGQPRKKP